MLGNTFHQDINNGDAVHVASWPNGIDLDRDPPKTKIHETNRDSSLMAETNKNKGHIIFKKKQPAKTPPN